MNIFKSVPKIVVFIAVVVGSSLLLAGCTPSQQSLDKYHELIRDADKLYEQNEYTQAVTKYSEAADVVPTESDAYFGIVKILVNKGRLSDAAEIIEKSAGRISSADKSRLYTIVANGYYDSDDYESAEKYYIKANSGVDNVPAKIGLARTYIKLGQLDKIKKNLDVTDTEDPNFAQAAILRAYLKLDDTKAAKEEISDLTEVELDDNTKAQYDSLIAAINTATDDKLYTAALLSREYINEGYPYLAIKLLEPQKDNMAEYPDGLYFLGRAYFDDAQYGSAIDVLNDALSFDSYTSEVYSLLAHSYYVNGDQDKAFDNFERAYTFAADADKEPYLIEYVDILLDQDQLTKAQTMLSGAEESFDVDLRLARLNYLKRDFEKMAFYLDKVGKMTLTDPQKMDYLYWVVIYDIENDEETSARENLALLRKLNRYNPDYYLLLGKLELAQNNTDEAKDALEKAIEYDLNGETTDSAKKLLARID